MIIAIPFLPSPQWSYSVLANAIRTQGGVESHSLLVVTQAHDGADASEFFESIRGLFASAQLRTIPAEADTRAPHLKANTLFREAAVIAAAYTPGEGDVVRPPLLYHHPRYYPQQPRWADLLQAEYFKSAEQVVGVTRPLPSFKAGGHTLAGGHEFIGPVLLDHGFASRSSLLSHVPGTESWRRYLRWEMLSSHRVTASIADKPGEGVLLATVAPTSDAKKLSDPSPKPVSSPVDEERPAAINPVVSAAATVAAQDTTPPPNRRTGSRAATK